MNKKLAGVSLVPVLRDEKKYPKLLNHNVGKGRELYGYLLSVNGEDRVSLILKDQEIVVEGIM